MLSAGLTFGILFTVVDGGTLIYTLKPDLRKALVPNLGVCVVTIGVAIMVRVTDYLHLLFFATAAMAVTSNLVTIFKFLPGRWKLAGRQLAHLGFGLMLIGILASSAFGESEKLTISRGQTTEVESLGLSLEYKGMVSDIDRPDNELILSMDDGIGSVELRPQLYYSERMSGIMRKPYIDRSLHYDLYVAPQQVLAVDNGDMLTLKKGETRQVGDITISFVGFEMGRHGANGSSNMRVATKINVDNQGEISTIAPAIVHIVDAAGYPTVQCEVAHISNGDRLFDVSIERIHADQGEVILNIPVLLSDGQVDRLVITVSRKPLINLVWAGTTFILMDLLVVAIRRGGVPARIPESRFTPPRWNKPAQRW